MVNTTKLIPTPTQEVVNFLGEDITVELNHYAYKADAAITVQKGETVILATVTCGELPIEANFLPLSVEYIEKFYAGGVISSSRFIKREMRPSDDAVLKARQVDHAIRSLFPKYWRRPVSVIITVLAYDGENDPEQLAVMAASTALMLSSIPFDGPSASIKAGLKSGELVWAPKESQEEELEMGMVLSVVNDRVLNIEGWAKEVDESTMKTFMEEGVAKLQTILNFQKDLAKKYGREKQVYEEKPAPQSLIDRVESEYGDRIEYALKNREIRIKEMNDVKAELAKQTEINDSGEEVSLDTGLIEEAVEYVARKLMRKMVLDKKERTSGRQLDEIRELKIEVGVLPRVHGSAVFTRGVTQCLSVLTLGSTRMAQTVASFEGEEQKHFMHHYNSPNYSYGDAGRYSYYPGRREIGHGNIGENALKHMIPDESAFPYTIRINSEIMSSNGSTSMAATCASSLALFDGGVPLKALVGGVALGLVTDDSDVTNYEILTDMEDVEDFYGDMDFKVAGTESGITAIQLDNKLKGVPVDILAAAFDRSKQARLEILAAMKAVIDKPRSEMKPYAPKVEIIKIKQEKIGELIGPGGKNIKGIIEKCDNKVDIDIQEDGTVVVMAANEDMRKQALELIEGLVGEAEVGRTYDAVVAKVVEYGIFVDVSPSIGGLVHVSELGDKFIKDVTKHYKVGDSIRVKVVGVDNVGRLKLSAKQADK